MVQPEAVAAGEEGIIRALAGGADRLAVDPLTPDRNVVAVGADEVGRGRVILRAKPAADRDRVGLHGEQRNQLAIEVHDLDG
ncbi:MAG: hypothetical protein HUU06_10995, partial [Planctomycetaceae bacterium]|nr:hypothetical protein [Planctomycetaceae bacterium]